jgi:hypothetical protein
MERHWKYRLPVGATMRRDVAGGRLACGTRHRLKRGIGGDGERGYLSVSTTSATTRTGRGG